MKVRRIRPGIYTVTTAGRTFYLARLDRWWYVCEVVPMSRDSTKLVDVCNGSTKKRTLAALDEWLEGGN